MKITADKKTAIANSGMGPSGASPFSRSVGDSSVTPSELLKNYTRTEKRHKESASESRQAFEEYRRGKVMHVASRLSKAIPVNHQPPCIAGEGRS
jgi:hypothetical protein